MATPERTKSQELTVMVFRDNLVSRTFRVPLKWITSFGVLLSLIAGSCVLLLLIAVKYYRFAAKTDPSHVLDLERRLGELSQSYESLELAAQNAKQSQDSVTATPNPEPTSTTTPVTATGASPKNQADILFYAFPVNVKLAPQELIPSVKIDDLKIRWKGNDLDINFNLLYVKKDGMGERGRLLILATGPSSLLGYPTGVLNLPRGANLISPERGEYFSVSRFRKSRARFAGAAPQGIKQIQILIFDAENLITLNERHDVPPSPIPPPKQEVMAPEQPPIDPQTLTEPEETEESGEILDGSNTSN